MGSLIGSHCASLECYFETLRRKVPMVREKGNPLQTPHIHEGPPGQALKEDGSLDMVSPTFTIQMTNLRGSAWPE